MISVITVVYNGERFIEESIKSILTQQEKNFELIIINDGSTDHTEEIILSFKDPRIIYVKENHSGFASSRNKALALAQGEFVIWQDADDISLPGRLSWLKNEFRDQKIGFVHSDMIYIDEKGIPFRYQNAIPIASELLMRSFLKMDTPFNNPSMMIRKSVLEGLKFNTNLKCGSDTALILEFIFKTKGAYVPLPLLLYRRHYQSMGQTYKDKKDRFAFLMNFLNTTPIEKLIPEAFWVPLEANLQESIAYAILFYFLRRRRFMDESLPYLERSVELAKGNQEILQFIQGMQALADAQCTKALDILIPLRSCVFNFIAENYIGEAYLIEQRYKEAYFHFLNVIKNYPDYLELVDNLKLAAIGQQITLESNPNYG